MNKSKIIIWVVVIVTLLIGAYFYFSSDASLPKTGNLLAQDNSAVVVGGNILPLLKLIDSLVIDPSFFVDPVYLSLKDYTVNINPQNVGRADPFAPLPGTSAGAIPTR